MHFDHWTIMSTGFLLAQDFQSLWQPHVSSSYIFSNEPGLLQLSANTLALLNVTMLRLDVPEDSPCFESALHRLLLASLTGYTVPIVNAFVQAFGTTGAVKVVDPWGHHTVISLQDAGFVWDPSYVHAACLAACTEFFTTVCALLCVGMILKSTFSQGLVLCSQPCSCCSRYRHW